MRNPIGTNQESKGAVLGKEGNSWKRGRGSAGEGGAAWGEGVGNGEDASHAWDPFPKGASPFHVPKRH